MFTTFTDWQNAFGEMSGAGLDKMAEIGPWPFVALMAVSLACSLFITFLYVFFYQNRGTGSQVHRSFPLVGVSITAIFVSIQFSLPLSLGLLGALSIVRFRTPIKEPEEIGFILLVVATSLTCATFNLWFLGIILLVAVAALFALRLARGPLGGRSSDGMLVLSVPTGEYRAKARELLGFLEEKLPGGRVDSVAENPDEAVVSYSFVQLPSERIAELSEGLTAIAAGARPNVFFNQPGQP